MIPVSPRPGAGTTGGRPIYAAQVSSEASLAGPPPAWNQPDFPDPATAAANPVVADAVRVLNTRRRRSRACRWLFLVVVVAGGATASTLTDGQTDVGSFPLLADAVSIAIGVALVAALVTAAVGWARGDQAVARMPPDVRDVAEAVVRYQRGNAFPVKFTAVITTIVAVIGAAFFFGLPMAVNGAAYLTVAGQTVTFTPESYNYACDSQGNCTQVTQGALGRGGSPTAYTWPHAVPLHHPFSVQLTLIRWPTAPRIYDVGDARTNLIAGLIFVVLGALFSLLFAWRMLRVTRLGHW